MLRNETADCFSSVGIYCYLNSNPVPVTIRESQKTEKQKFTFQTLGRRMDMRQNEENEERTGPFPYLATSLVRMSMLHF